MYFLKICVFASLIFGFTEVIKAQEPEAALENIRLNYANEKIYLQYDKPSYVAGETIWFKAYLLSGFLPSNFSSTLFVELVSDSGRIIEKKVLPIVNSAATGNFNLSPDLQQANYTIRAYTARLLNFGQNHFYFKQLAVYNPSSSIIAANPERQYSLYLFPESGNFIGGVKNVVAFKCTDQWGNPAEAEGSVVNSAGAVIANFSSIHDGMGKFEITPTNGETYSAVSILGKTENKKINLPLSVAMGNVLSIQKINDKTYFYVNAETVTNDLFRPAFLLATMENTVIFKIPLAADQKNFKAQIPLADIPSGILQLTLFNSSNQPLAERLLFNKNKDFIANGNLRLDTVSTADRARNVYSFELEDSIDGNYSVSVTAADMEINQASRDNIYSRFLITNDIKGYVYNPQYYFEGNDEERMNKLDLVMLTNGWRRFTWSEILSNRLPKIANKDPNYISVRGTAMDEKSGKPLEETNLSFFVRTKEWNDLMIVQAGKEGSFDLSGMIFYDTANIFVQNLFSKNSKPQIKLNSLPISGNYRIPEVSFAIPVKRLSIDQGSEKVKNMYSLALDEFNKKSVLLSDVTVKAKAKNPTKQLEERYIRNGAFNSYASKTLDFINDNKNAISSVNIFEYLKARLPGVNITGTAGNYTLNYRGSLSMRGGLIPMKLFLDESEVFSTNDIAIIPMSQIAMVKLYSTGFVGAEGNGAGGTLAIYTKRGDDMNTMPGTDNLFKMRVEGYTQTKEFFSPDYSLGNGNLQGEDRRSTLYWDPYLETNPSNKKFSFGFYNADRVKKFKIVLEGITSEGKLLHVEKLVE